MIEDIVTDLIDDLRTIVPDDLDGIGLPGMMVGMVYLW